MLIPLVHKELLGQGGFAKVFKVYNRLDQTSYAIKKIPLDPDEFDSVLAVLSEVRILARLSHPHIIRYHNTWVQEAEPYECCIQMELCDSSLRDYISKRDTISSSQSLAFFRHILDGVAYLHHHDVIHRDLKPENILIKIIDGEMIAKISDFGLSRLKHNEPLIGDSFVEEGTELYVPVRNKTTSTLVDIYSLGIVLFELFSTFYTEMERIITLRKLRHTGIPPTYFEDVYPWVSLMVRNMLSENCPSAKTLRKAVILDDDPAAFCRDIVWGIVLTSLS